jgi:hypothetical protein
MLNETAVSYWAYWTSLDTITAYSTLFLVIVTGILALVTWMYVREVKSQAATINQQAGSIKDLADAMKRQADTMAEQSKFIRDQSDAMTRQAETMESQFDIIREESATMKRQADTMDGQSSLMHENMEYDRLAKKYDRVNQEIAKLIGPLYARRNDKNIFSLEYKRSGRIFVSPTFKVPDPSPDAKIYDFVSFWDSIDQNMYLNRSYEFECTFRNYSLNVVDYYQALESGADEKRKKELDDLFNQTRKPDFIREIEKRYLELSNDLKDIESELSKKKIKG